MLPLFEYWSNNPTVNMLLAGFMGIHPKMTKDEAKQASLGAAELGFMAEMPVRTLDNCPSEIQSWVDELKAKQGVN